jgi:hypothetical protein
MPSLYCVFKHSKDSTLETVVGFLGGRYVHVDLVSSEVGKSYTSYMFEPFSCNEVSYEPEGHTCLEIHVTADEHEAAVKYMDALVERKVPYNYTDLIYGMMPTRDFMGDVTDPVSKLYCSQAVLMCLRHSVVRNTVLAEALKGVNGRFLTPTALHALLEQADIPCASIEGLCVECSH